MNYNVTRFTCNEYIDHNLINYKFVRFLLEHMLYCKNEQVNTKIGASLTSAHMCINLRLVSL